jgi:hypothetical protein
MAGINTVVLSVVLINLRTNPSDRLITPVRDPGLPLSIFKEWIKPRKVKPSLST